MRTFVTKGGCKFMFEDLAENAIVGADGFPTFADIRELLSYVGFMRTLVGPRVAKEGDADVDTHGVVWG